MTYGYLFIVSIVTVAVHAEDYSMSEVSSEWSKKDTVCSVAIPPLKHTPSDISVEINSTLIENDDAWVAYTRTQRLFDYIGCFKKDMLVIQPESAKVGSPGQCFGLCYHVSLIGVCVNECYCIKETRSLADLRSNFTKCTKECESQSGVVCGSHEGNGAKYMSVYKDAKLDENITSDNDKDSNCLRLDRFKTMFVWTHCLKELLVVCDFNVTCVATSSPGTNKSSIKSANSCFSNGGFPLRTKNCKYDNSSKYTNSVWTSFIRSNVISTSSNQSVDYGIQYGYVRRQKGSIILKFTKDGSKEKMVLCNNPHVQNVKADKKYNLLLYIAIIVAAVLPIVLIIICTVVLWRRRKCRHRHKWNNSPHYDSPIISFIMNANYAHVDDIISHKPANQDSDANQRIEGIHGQVYDVAIQDSVNALETTCKKEGQDQHHRTYDRIKDVNCKLGFGKEGDTQSKGDDVVHNYFILEKQTQQETQSNYDKTGFSKQTPNESDVNIYNKLGFEKEQTYDHAFQNKPNVCAASSDTYNTFAAVHSHTKIK